MVKIEIPQSRILDEIVPSQEGLYEQIDNGLPIYSSIPDSTLPKQSAACIDYPEGQQAPLIRYASCSPVTGEIDNNPTKDQIPFVYDHAAPPVNSENIEETPEPQDEPRPIPWLFIIILIVVGYFIIKSYK